MPPIKLRKCAKELEVRDLPGGMKARQPLSQEEQAQLSSNDEEGSAGRQVGFLCHDRARGTRKGCKTGCVWMWILLLAHPALLCHTQTS